MAAKTLDTPKGHLTLNDYLSTRSYVNGFTPSGADSSVFDNLSKAPGTNTPHALRWYNHIKSYSADERKKFPGDKSIPSALTSGAPAGKPAAAPVKAAQVSKQAAPADDDDDVDLFGSEDEEDEAAAKIREDRLKAYAEKKSQKPSVIAKSSIVLDVKPWDDETDMAAMEISVRSIAMDGLLWGASKLVPVGYGINKLQIGCVVEDDKVSVDALSEEIQNFEDFVQSVDIAAFNKI